MTDLPTSNHDEMEAQVRRLAEQTWKKFQNLDDSERYLIGLSGIPGSGKTTIAKSIVHEINMLSYKAFHDKNPKSSPERHASSLPEIAFSVPLDGFHLTRAQLAAMPDPEEAAYRRGAAFTFDAAGYLALITQLRKAIEATTSTIFAPSFDHAIKDPVADDIPIRASARIVILEGLYTALNRETWRDAAHLMDEIWVIDCPKALATERVAKRNFAAGLSPSLEEAVDRTLKNDMRNADEILGEQVPNVTERIKSIDDERWKSDELKKVERDEAENLDSRTLKRFQAQRMDSIAEMAVAGAGC